MTIERLKTISDVFSFDSKAVELRTPIWFRFSIVGYAAFIFALIVFNVHDMPRGLGSGELAWTIAETYKPHPLLSLDTWITFPPPLIQLVHTFLMKLTGAGESKISLVHSILLVNLLLACASSLLTFKITLHFMSRDYAASAALLALTSQTAMQESYSGGSIALAIFFSLLSIFLALRSTQVERQIFLAAVAGLCLTIATMARAETIFIAPVVAWFLFAKSKPVCSVAYFGAAAIYFSLTEIFAPLFIADYQAYSQYAKQYGVNSDLSIMQWLKTPLFKVGFLENFPFLISVLVLPFTFLCLLNSKYRLLSILFLSSFLPILWASISGEILSNRPYYFAISGFMAAMPLLAAFEFLQIRFRNSISNVPFRYLRPVILAGVAALPLLSVLNCTSRINDDEWYRSAKAIKENLVVTLAPGESTFSDHTFYWSSYFVAHSISAGAKYAYAYQRYCCASEKARSIIGESELNAIISDKSHVLASLDAKTKQLAKLIWGQGFIESYRPEHFILLEDKYYGLMVSRPWTTAETASYVRPYILGTEKVDGKRIHFVKLKYADAAFCLFEKASTEHFVLYSAIYDTKSTRIDDLSSCEL